jgi:hypothetical protein
MRSAPVIAFSPIGGRPRDFVTEDFVTGDFVTVCFVTGVAAGVRLNHPHGNSMKVEID